MDTERRSSCQSRNPVCDDVTRHARLWNQEEHQLCCVSHIASAAPGVAIPHRLQQKLSHQLRWALGYYPNGAETSKNNPHNPNIPRHRRLDEPQGGNVGKEGNVSDGFQPKKDVKFANGGVGTPLWRQQI